MIFYSKYGRFDLHPYNNLKDEIKLAFNSRVKRFWMNLQKGKRRDSYICLIKFSIIISQIS